VAAVPGLPVPVDAVSDVGACYGRMGPWSSWDD
jgi:hypothetical protein